MITVRITIMQAAPGCHTRAHLELDQASETRPAEMDVLVALRECLEKNAWPWCHAAYPVPRTGDMTTALHQN